MPSKHPLAGRPPRTPVGADLRSSVRRRLGRGVHRALAPATSSSARPAVGRVVGDRQPLGLQVVQRGPDERDEQRVRPGRPRLEFRVRLGGHQERVQRRDPARRTPPATSPATSRTAADPPARAPPVGVVDLVAVPVPLGNAGAAVDLGDQRALGQPRRVGTRGASCRPCPWHRRRRRAGRPWWRSPGRRRWRRTRRSSRRRARPGSGRPRSRCTAARGTDPAPGSC